MSTDTGADALSQESIAPEQNNAMPSEATENANNAEAMVADMEKRLNGQSAVISRMERMLKDVVESSKKVAEVTTEAPTKEGKDADFEKAKAELMQMKAELEQKAQATREKQKRHLVVSELQSKGLNAIAADEAYISMTAHEGDRLSLSEDEATVSYQKGEFDDQVSIGSFVDTFLQSDRGSLYVPKKVNPNAGNRATGTDATGKRYITGDQLKTLSPAELQSGNFILKD
jgi:hypothetical protein